MPSRIFARIARCLPVACLVLTLHGTAQADEASVARPMPDEALRTLRDGNDRFTAGTPGHPRQDVARAAATARDGQFPLATVLSCSDSRVPVEIVFDAGIGDLFVVRVAGNVADVDEIGSIEYGVGHLGTPLLVVLGHSKCGAVTAVVTDAEVHGLIPPLVENIRPAAAAARQAFPDLAAADLVPEAIRANVWQTIDDICHNSPATRELLAAGKLMIVGAVYDLETGSVNWLGPHPDQGRLLRYDDAGPLAYAAHGGDAAPPAAGEQASGEHATDEQATDEHAEPAHGAPEAHAAQQGSNPGAGFWLVAVGIGLANFGLGFAVKHLLPAFKRG